MTYHSIYFSFENLLQIALVTCKAGVIPPDPMPNSQDNWLHIVCTNYLDAIDVYNMGDLPTYVTAVLMQGMQPFEIARYVDVMPQTQIYKFYKCLNTDYSQLDFLNTTKFSDEIPYPPQILSPIYHRDPKYNLNLCKPKCISRLDWKTSRFEGDKCWYRDDGSGEKG